MKGKRAIYFLVVAIGCIQIFGYLIGSKDVRGLGQAICSSPLPIVFTEVKGVETFASDFFVVYQLDGVAQRTQITPEMYARLKGPYNRRNVYGAAISYGPVLPEKLWRAVLEYGLCEGTLLEELGIPQQAKSVAIAIETRTAGRDDKWLLEPKCP